MMGKVIMSGIVPPLVAPISGILASDLAVGTTVKLMENGVATEYLVVNHGKPSGSSLYDDSCDGLWLLRKDLYESREWHSSNNSTYSASTIHSYLNSTFLGLLDSDIQAVVKQVKIPYVNGTGSGGSVASGANGLSAKIFLLSGYEVGWTKSTNRYFPIDGACLSYFSGTAATDSKRIGYLNGAATVWWLRSPSTYQNRSAWSVVTSGSYRYDYCSLSYGIRPALVLPPNALLVHVIWAGQQVRIHEDDVFLPVPPLG